MNAPSVAAPSWDEEGRSERRERLGGPAHAAPSRRRPTWTPAPVPAQSQVRPRPTWTPAQTLPAPAIPAPGRPARSAANRGPAPSTVLSLVSRLWAQRTRLTIFGLNGIAVFAAGLMIQIALVQYAGMGHVPSYIAQTVASIQLSFLLSRYLTWRERSVSFLHGLVKFNAQQLAVTGLGMVGYALLERLGMNYIIANVLVTGLLTPVSFLSSHLWSLRPSASRGGGAPQTPHAGSARVAQRAPETAAPRG